MEKLLPVLSIWFWETGCTDPMSSCVCRGKGGWVLNRHLHGIGLVWPGLGGTHQLWHWPPRAGFCASRIPSTQGSQPMVGQWPEANPKPRPSHCGHYLPWPPGRDSSASPFPAPLPCHCIKGGLAREAGSARELPGALNCLACISQPLWGQLFLSLLWGLFADPLPTTLLSPQPLSVPVQNCF